MPRHTFFCIDAHTCGNPVRVVAGGAPMLPNVPMAEKREIFLRDHDWVRRALMFEPRGHDVMSGSILYPPSRDDCDLGVLFIEVSGCLPMCGHGTIGTVTVAIEEGLVEPRQEGQPRDRGPCRKDHHRIHKGRAICRTGSALQYCELPARVRCGPRYSGAGNAAGRSVLWRQLLRHRRAASELGRSRRHVGRRDRQIESSRSRGGRAEAWLRFTPKIRASAASAM